MTREEFILKISNNQHVTISSHNGMTVIDYDNIYHHTWRVYVDNVKSGGSSYTFEEFSTLFDLYCNETIQNNWNYFTKQAEKYNVDIEFEPYSESIIFSKKNIDAPCRCDYAVFSENSIFAIYIKDVNSIRLIPVCDFFHKRVFLTGYFWKNINNIIDIFYNMSHNYIAVRKIQKYFESDTFKRIANIEQILKYD